MTQVKWKKFPLQNGSGDSQVDWSRLEIHINHPFQHSTGPQYYIMLSTNECNLKSRNLYHSVRADTAQIS
jgi:hypothetical protein